MKKPAKVISKLDALAIGLFLAAIIINLIAKDWVGAVYGLFFLIFVLIGIGHRHVLNKYKELTNDMLELIEILSKGIEGREIVEKTIHKFEIRKVNDEQTDKTKAKKQDDGKTSRESTNGRQSAKAGPTRVRSRKSQNKKKNR